MLKEEKNGIEGQSKPPKAESGHKAIFGFIFYFLVLLIAVWKSSSLQKYIIVNIWLIGIILGLVAILFIYFWYKKRELSSSVKHRIGFTIYVAIPVLFGIVAAIVFIPDKYHLPILRSLFLVIVCFLPATMYYLFISSRKSSLLQDYFTNLSRLGLFKCQVCGTPEKPYFSESKLERDTRVMTYVQKFESIHGPIPEELAQEIVEKSDPDYGGSKVPEFHKYSTGGYIGRIFVRETALPVLIATLLIGLGWFLVLPPWETSTAMDNSSVSETIGGVLKPGRIPVYFAFLGAYFFALQMLFRRYVRKDLGTNAYISVSLRIILAVIGTWVIVETVTIMDFSKNIIGGQQEGLLLIAFVIGAFPPIAWQLIQAAFIKITFAKVLIASLSSEMPVSQLDGLTVWHEARLAEEDIENVPNMATVDIVELMLHTKIPTDRIIDWVDQALLFTQLGAERETAVDKEGNTSKKTSRQYLRDHGIRTASALIVAYNKGKTRGDLEEFEKVLPSEARSRIRSLVDTLVVNPNLELVRNWRQLPRFE